MLEFSVSNQLLSRLDATKVVADSENYLECAFQFSGDWSGAVAVAVFGHSKVKEPISVRIIGGKCRVPHEVIKSHGFQLSVYGTAEDEEDRVCHIPTNALTVEVEASGAGQGLNPTEPTQSMYTTLMASISAGEKAVAEAKTSASASAQAAMGAKELAEKAAGKAAESAKSCAVDAGNARAIWDIVQSARPQAEALEDRVRSYVVGTQSDRVVCDLKNICWSEAGVHTTQPLGLEPNCRYRVRVDDVWYDVPAEWTFIKRSTEQSSGEAELTSTGGGVAQPSGHIDEEEIPIVPPDLDPIPVPLPDTGDGEEKPEVPEGGEGKPEVPGGDERPEVPGGEEVNPNPNPDTGDDGSDIPVVKPAYATKTVMDVITLQAGDVVIEEVRAEETGEGFLGCKFTTKDKAVREIEIRTDGTINAQYFYEKAMDAARRAESAAARAEAAAAQRSGVAAQSDTVEREEGEKNGA